MDGITWQQVLAAWWARASASAAGAEALLTYSHPGLSVQERRAILAATAVDSGHPLEVGRTAADSGWTRIDLAQALTR